MYRSPPPASLSLRAYAGIAAQLRFAIRQGQLLAGDRLPSVRRLASTHRVSPPTAERALRELESEGLVVARPRSGFFVAARTHEQAPPRPVAAPRPVTLSGRVHEMFALARSPGLIRFGSATPHSGWLPVQAIQRSMLRSFKKLGADALLYSVPPGSAELRRQIARRSALWQGNLDPGRILVTAGATQAMHIALRVVTQPGDAVAVESPCYFGTLMLLKSLGLRALEVPLSPLGGIDLGMLATALDRHRVAAVVATPTTNNPTGLTMPVANKRRLVELLAGHGIPLIEDDPYGEIGPARRKEPPCKAFDERGLVLYCSSVSKTLFPGMRIGWLEAGARAAAALDVRVETSLGGSQVEESALADLMANGELDRHLRRFAVRMEASVAAISARVQQSWPEGTIVSPRSSGYLLWVALPAGVDAGELQREAAGFGIGICPGTMFSADGTGFGDHVRLNCAMPVSAKVLAGIDRLGELVRKLRPNHATTTPGVCTP